MKLHGNIEELQYKTVGSAAVDLRSTVDVVVPISPLTNLTLNAFHFLRNAQDLREWQSVFSSWVEEAEANSNVVVVPTGVYIEEAKDLEHVFITPRSGLALNESITVLNSPGLVDPDYPEEIGVILINHAITPFEIRKGDRIAQMILMTHGKFDDITISQEIRESGFGSTGVK